MTVVIRPLTEPDDLAEVRALQADLADYWALAGDNRDPATRAADFFTDAPPGCDPAASQRLGLIVDGRLGGLAELSFGFPGPQDAYLGQMLLAPAARGRGHGRSLLAGIEARARAARAPALYLGVLEANPRGRAFWLREGFRPTGVSRRDDSHDPPQVIHRLVKPLE